MPVALRSDPGRERVIRSLEKAEQYGQFAEETREATHRQQPAGSGEEFTPLPERLVERPLRLPRGGLQAGQDIDAEGAEDTVQVPPQAYQLGEPARTFARVEAATHEPDAAASTVLAQVRLCAWGQRGEKTSPVATDAKEYRSRRDRNGHLHREHTTTRRRRQVLEIRPPSLKFSPQRRLRGAHSCSRTERSSSSTYPSSVRIRERSAA